MSEAFPCVRWEAAIDENGNQWLVCEAGADGAVVARIPRYRYDEDKRQAEYIATAVNSYAVMVNALTQAEQAFSMNADTNDEIEACASIRAALAIAKGDA